VDEKLSSWILRFDPGYCSFSGAVVVVEEVSGIRLTWLVKIIILLKLRLIFKFDFLLNYRFFPELLIIVIVSGENAVVVLVVIVITVELLADVVDVVFIVVVVVSNITLAFEYFEEYSKKSLFSSIISLVL